jgi:hypothetical protein
MAAEPPAARGPAPSARRRDGPRWTWGTTFLASTAGAGLAFLASLAVSVVLRARQGELTAPQSEALLAVVYWGCYPLAFIALVALAVQVFNTMTGRVRR